MKFKTTKYCNLSLGLNDRNTLHDPDQEISMGVLGMMHLLKPSFCDLCYQHEFQNFFEGSK